MQAMTFPAGLGSWMLTWQWSPPCIERDATCSGAAVDGMPWYFSRHWGAGGLVSLIMSESPLAVWPDSTTSPAEARRVRLLRDDDAMRRRRSRALQQQGCDAFGHCTTYPP